METLSIDKLPKTVYIIIECFIFLYLKIGNEDVLMEGNLLLVGLDIGSTTIKIVVMDENKKIIYTDYTRHLSDTKNTMYQVLSKLLKDFPNNKFKIALTGSGALEIAKLLVKELLKNIYQKLML